MTVGSTARSLLKQLPKLLRRRRCKLFTSLQSPIALFGGFFQCSHPLGRGAVFSLGVVGRLDVDFTKGDNVGTAYDSNIVTARRSGQPTPQILLSIRNRKSLHKDFISSHHERVNHAYWRLASGIEVDFIVNDMQVAIESKAAAHITADQSSAVQSSNVQ
jgi:hypothetical protein